MPDDVKQARPTLPVDCPGGVVPSETSQKGSPARPARVPGDDLQGSRAASERCRECLAALAHRLAQNATALRGTIELGLLGKCSQTEYRSVLEQSLQLADGMVQAIVALRDFAESSAPAGPTQSVPLAGAVREIQAEVQGLAELRELRFQLHVQGSPNISANAGRLREGLQSLLAWVVQNSAGGGIIELEVSASDGEGRVSVVPPRLDLQYLQVKVLEDIANPGLLFSHAVKSDALGWAINRRLVEGLGGRLEIMTEGAGFGCIRARFPLAPDT